MKDYDGYDQRLCAFLDLLGFRAAVDRMSHDPSEFSRMRRILTTLHEHARSRKRPDGSVVFYSREMTAFSDSLVISYPINEVGCTRSLFEDIIWLFRELLTAGVVLRGGVSVGRLYHAGGVVFGDAMVRAYHLESKVADYARVVVDEEAAKAETVLALKLEPIAATVRSWNLSKNAGLLLRVDSDNCKFIDLFEQALASVPFPESGNQQLMNIRQGIMEALNRADIPKHRAKVEWLASRFNEAIEDFPEKISPIPLEDR